jgi:hypothetical protein
MNPSLDSFLEKLSADYAKRNAPAEETAPKAPKTPGKVGRPRKAVAPPAQNGVEGASQRNASPAPEVLALPPTGSIAGGMVVATKAEAFYQKFRRAASRAEQISAISAYIGYDRGKNAPSHGAQEMMAKATAKKELNPLVILNAATAALHHGNSAMASAAGYVAGMPDNVAKRIQNLKGREVLATDAIIENTHIAEDTARAEQVRQDAINAVWLEVSRLATIRQELASV